MATTTQSLETFRPRPPARSGVEAPCELEINGDIIRWRSHRHSVPIERAKLELRVADFGA
jgi:hypothetical protein